MYVKNSLQRSKQLKLKL